MYQIIRQFLSIPNDSSYNVESYVIYTTMAISCLLVIGTFRLLLDVVRSFRR